MPRGQRRPLFLERARGRPSATAWRRTTLDIPKRRHKNIQYVESAIELPGYDGSLRQIAVRGLGREDPCWFVTANTSASARDVILRYTGRNGVEDSLGISVNFFHLDCLASAVRLNVDLDVAWTVVAHGCYRWLASKLRGFDKAKPKQL